MSHWAEYMKELLGNRMFIEKDYGFVSYSFPDWAPTCAMIHDTWIAPTERKKGYSRELLDEVIAAAKHSGKTAILGQVEIGTKLAKSSLAMQFALGFELLSSEGGKIMLRKQI